MANPPRALVSPDNQVDLIGLAEREIGFTSGSKVNTLADLVLALFGHGRADNAVSEDLSREVE